MQFTGMDADIELATEHAEFDAWEWVSPERLPELVAPFMRGVYLRVLAEFRALWSGQARPENENRGLGIERWLPTD